MSVSIGRFVKIAGARLNEYARARTRISTEIHAYLSIGYIYIAYLSTGYTFIYLSGRYASLD